MKTCRFFFQIFIFCFAALINTSRLAAQPQTVLDAMRHCENEFNEPHERTWVYKDFNYRGNQFHPHAEGDHNIIVYPAQTDAPAGGRTYETVIFPLSDSTKPFHIWRFTSPEDNYGGSPGLDLSRGDKLTFSIKGNGKVEAQAFGVNCRPFQNFDFPFQDGADIRSTGIIELTDEWKEYTIDLKDSTIWVYKDPLAGYENRFPKIALMGTLCFINLDYDADDGENNTCIKIDWHWCYHSLNCYCGCGPFWSWDCWAGAYFFPPEGDWTGTQGLNLAGIKRIRFKAKMTVPGKVKFLFGKDGDSCKKTISYTLTNDWQWYEWDLQNKGECKIISGGFGFSLDKETNNSVIYLDSIYYVGTSLVSDLSQVIGGFTLTAHQVFNQDTVVAHIDEISFNAPRLDALRVCQSFVPQTDSIDISQQLSAHTYDNALLLIADLYMYGATRDEKYLNYAKLIGDAFVFAQSHDRYFNDGRLRNVYASGDLVYNKDNTARIAGWWDAVLQQWNEDIYFHGTSTGNMAWAGIALASLFEATKDYRYLDAAERIARWCIKNTETNFGFSGGLEGWEDTQVNVSWKSTEHNIDLYALFYRLYLLTGASYYKEAAINTKTFVHTMWSPELHCFWTGTTDDGVTINKSNIPVDIQAWYIQAFQDLNSQYTEGIDWAIDNCYLEGFESPNYQALLNGFDFNNDRDGIWFEGTAQVALALKMLGNDDFANLLLETIEYVQKNGDRNNGLGIVAADHNHVSTGFYWEYHNRLHIGATCWYVFAQMGINPYYCPIPDCGADLNMEWKQDENAVYIAPVFPNPSSGDVHFEFRLPVASNVELKIFDMAGRLVRTVVNEKLESRFYRFNWGSNYHNGIPVPEGVYISALKIDNESKTRKIVVIR